jgi:ETC complex I subunit-like protein
MIAGCGTKTGGRHGGEKAMALARIYRPSKTAMQSGRGRTDKWVLEYEPASRRDPDPLMGWSSARDTLNEVRLRFPTLDEAVAFAQKQAIDYTVTEPHARTPKSKSYADNFRYDRVRT